ncbi:MAG: PilZ domain-containing protein [Mobilitalea sp.]
MKLIDIPANILVELQFDYIGVVHKIGVGLLYKNAGTVYVSAIKNAGKTIPASKLKNVIMIYKAVAGVYLFKDLAIRSISYNGQNLYVIQTEQEAQKVNHRNAVRLSLGVNVSAKIIMTDGSVNHIYCILKDISLTGMGILSNRKMDKMDKIEISFRVNDNKETVVGNIIHIHEFVNGKGFLYGCEFDEPNGSIGKYVERQYALNNIKNEVSK